MNSRLGPAKSLRAAVAVAVKDMRSIIRQPGLVVTLIAGPLLILGVFGAGFDRTVGPLDTVVVVEDGSSCCGTRSSMRSTATSLWSSMAWYPIVP